MFGMEIYEVVFFFPERVGSTFAELNFAYTMIYEKVVMRSDASPNAACRTAAVLDGGHGWMHQVRDVSYGLGWWLLNLIKKYKEDYCAEVAFRFRGGGVRFQPLSLNGLVTLSNASSSAARRQIREGVARGFGAFPKTKEGVNSFSVDGPPRSCLKCKYGNCTVRESEWLLAPYFSVVEFQGGIPTVIFPFRINAASNAITGLPEAEGGLCP
ncbi:hypothetical protein CPC08DRAFT_779836 [Agrocybe pediades]|nr:hypothetical protein CPC08DRAFT_779836 [Agrocybe pediades]